MNHDIMQTLIDAGVSEARRKTLVPVIENVTWMREHLDAARLELTGCELVEEYTNGNGMTGDRENLALRAYESLFKTYMLGMSKILDALPKETPIAAADEELKPSTVLEFVRNKHRKEA